MNNISEQLTSLNNNLRTINSEVSNQASLIAQIQALANNLPDTGSDKREIFGSHLIALPGDETYIVPEEDVTIDLTDYTVNAYFVDETGTALYSGIQCIEFHSDGRITIESDASDELTEFRLVYDGAEWHAEVVDYGEVVTYVHEDRVVEFLGPAEVTKEEYTLLKGLFNAEDISVHDLGYDIGYNDGYDDGFDTGFEQGYASNIEILSELMEWAVVTASDECGVSIYNYHSSKYLIANLYVWNAWGDEHYDTITIGPNEGDSYYYSSSSQDTYDWEVAISGVRFSEDGT